jgi:hypothetical protein
MYANMSTITLSEREIEILIRWSEVHVKKLAHHISKNTRHSIDTTREYIYRGTITIMIYMEARCIQSETLSRCPYESCESLVYVPCIMAYILPYKDDILFQFELPNETYLPLLRMELEKHVGEKKMCVCGRLGKMDHVIESERGKCNNCYIYGMVRGDNCSICLSDDGKPWIKTSCGHYFHDMCWYGVREEAIDVKKCPMCRSIQTYQTITKI